MSNSLTNEDFKKIVSMTPRRVDTFELPGAKKSQFANMGEIKKLSYKDRKDYASNEIKKEKNRERAAKYKKKNNKESKQTGQEPNEKEVVGYRDRAKERREGKYDDEGVNILTSFDYPHNPTPRPSTLTPTAEGGGMKGIIRNEGEKNDNQQQRKVGRGIGRGETMGSRVWSVIVANDPLRTKRQLVTTGRFMTDPNYSLRSAYHFDVSTSHLNPLANEMPTMILRSKESVDIDSSNHQFSISIPPNVQLQLSNMFTLRSKHPRKKRKLDLLIPTPPPSSSKQPPPPSSSSFDDDDDIFPEAKEYEVKANNNNNNAEQTSTFKFAPIAINVKKEKEEKNERDNGNGGNNNNNNGDKTDTPFFDNQQIQNVIANMSKLAPPPPPPSSSKQSVSSSSSSDSQFYAECYNIPGSGGDDIASAIYSDEEDEDYRMMDPGPRKKSTLRQWDFETKQDWERYMDQREATPKAAFQFGVKSEHGRKSKRKMNRASKKD